MKLLWTSISISISVTFKPFRCKRTPLIKSPKFDDDKWDQWATVLRLGLRSNMLIETIYICISYICLYEQTSSHVYIILDASQTKGSFFYRKLMYFSSLRFAYFISILLNFIAIYLTTSFFGKFIQNTHICISHTYIVIVESLEMLVVFLLRWRRWNR